jgi:hypothetical protein
VERIKEDEKIITCEVNTVPSEKQQKIRMMERVLRLELLTKKTEFERSSSVYPHVDGPKEGS